MSQYEELVKRVCATAAQLRAAREMAAFGGEETGVRVKNVDFLLTDLDEAASAILSLQKENEEASAKLDAAREFVQRHPALSLLDIAEFEAFLTVPKAMTAAMKALEPKP